MRRQYVRSFKELLNRPIEIYERGGKDIYPLVMRYAREYAVPPAVILVIINKRSMFNALAVSIGEWPDVRFGIGLTSVIEAMQHGIGDGMATRENVTATMRWLLDCENAIRLVTHRLRDIYRGYRLYILDEPNMGWAGCIMAFLGEKVVSDDEIGVIARETCQPYCKVAEYYYKQLNRQYKGYRSEILRFMNMLDITEDKNSIILTDGWKSEKRPG